MRLLELLPNGNFRLTNRFLEDLPSYAILSHIQGEESEEVTFEDMVAGSGRGKAGYKKIEFCGKQAARDGLRYFWIDSCCIDKSRIEELAEAISSKFRWYQNAAKCYVYLSDVSTAKQKASDQIPEFTWEPAFRTSSWFTRSWTLQELLAPVSVEFFSLEGKRLGDKKSLGQQIHEITGIAVQALQGTPLSHFSVAERMSWAQNRTSLREEDMAYSLLGIFDVHMPFIYGEGRQVRSDDFKRRSIKRQRTMISTSRQQRQLYV